jgi:GMP synthase-like glutamine amidotransferase
MLQVSDLSRRPTILALEHETDSGPALLAERAEQLGFAVEIRNPADGLPESMEGYVALIVMGAAPSVNDEHVQGWFQPEVRLIQEADSLGVPIFGVCFGAQAMAVAFGGSVARASKCEVGWYTVETTNAELIEEGPWFEWHIDSITPPPQATVIARTAQCVQAYTLGRHLAVQFHPEVTDAQARDWSDADPEGLTRDGHSLTKDGLVAQSVALLPQAQARAFALFDRFCTHAGLHVPVLA